MNTQPHTLVIGAGPGGSTVAWGLARRGYDVLLIDWAEFPRDKTCGDGLTPMAIQSLQRMGALARVEAAGAHRINEVGIRGPYGSAWRGELSEYMDRGKEAYGLVLPRTVFDDILRQFAIEAGADYQGQVRVEDIDMDDDRIVRVHARNEADEAIIFEPRQVVVAVGANVGLLKRAGLLTRHRPNFIRAVRGYFEPVTAISGSFEFYFDDELVPGYGWIFPAGGGIANVGVGMRPDGGQVHGSTRSLLDIFVDRRQRDGSMPDAEPAGAVKGYPLRIDYSGQKVAGKNWLIIGEAAGLVNPVTGEGIDLAIESGLIAVDAMHTAVQRGHSDHRLYQRRLRKRFLMMFIGLRALRAILVNRLMMDPILHVMKRHRFLASSVINIVQGFASPLWVIHPLFLIQLSSLATPRRLWIALKKGLSRLNRRLPVSRSS